MGLLSGDLIHWTKTQRQGRTDTHTGGFQVIFHPINAKVTLAHFFTPREMGGTKGTGNDTAMTADTQVLMNINDAILISLIKRPGRTDHDAGRIAAVQTCNGKKRYLHVRVAPFFRTGYVPEGWAVIRQVVLIQAGYHTGHTATATGNVKRKAELFHGK
jgi:hypothetical protein